MVQHCVKYGSFLVCASPQLRSSRVSNSNKRGLFFVVVVVPFLYYHPIIFDVLLLV